MTPAWVDTSIWWHVYPLGALGADTTGRDRTCHRSLRGLVDWLDHAVRLGVNGLALGPVFAATSHGYDTVDHFRIDERLGTEEDFDALVAACQERGVRVLLDGVFNHVGRAHPWFADGASGRPVFEGHDDLVVLDHASPAVADHVVAVMDHWLARGVDGWRLDAAYAVPREFWHGVLPQVGARYPAAYFVGEVIHGDYAVIVADTTFDSVTQYELWKAIWSSLTDRNLFELAWALRRHDEFVRSFAPWTFVGNHDVTRIRTKLGDDSLVDIATVLLAMLPGTPAIYYGDEFGFTGVKEDRAGGDDAVRPALPDRPPIELPPRYRLHQQLFGLRRRHPGLHRAHLEVRDLANETFCLRVDDLEIMVNIAATDRQLPTGMTRVELASRARLVDGVVHLEPGGWLVASEV